MSATNRGAARMSQDDYITPAWATRAILRYLAPNPKLYPSKIIECCAGRGAIVEVINEIWPESEIHAVEINDERARACDVHRCTVHNGDFLQYRPVRPFDLAITNPPYDSNLLVPIIEKALTVARIVTMLVPVQWATGGMCRRTFRREHPFDLLTLERRPSFAVHVQCGPKKADSCGWHLYYLPTDVLPATCPRCGRKTRKTSTDSSDYAWALFYPGCRRSWEPLDVEE